MKKMRETPLNHTTRMPDCCLNLQSHTRTRALVLAFRLCLVSLLFSGSLNLSLSSDEKRGKRRGKERVLFPGVAAAAATAPVTAAKMRTAGHRTHKRVCVRNIPAAVDAARLRPHSPLRFSSSLPFFCLSLCIDFSHIPIISTSHHHRHHRHRHRPSPSPLSSLLFPPFSFLPFRSPDK